MTASSRVLKAQDVAVSALDAEALAAQERAVERAYEAGRQQGIAESDAGYRAGVAAIADALARSGSIFASAAADTMRLDATTLTGLSFDVAQWFIEATVQADPAVLVDAVRDAIDKLDDDHASLILHVSPKVADALALEGALGAVTVRADAELDVADFRLAGDASSVERSWRHVTEQLGPEIVSALQPDGRPAGG